MVSIWLSYMLMERDHRLVCVRDWAREREQTIKSILGIELRDTDCSDDRLGNILTVLGSSDKQQEIDKAMLSQWIRVYSLPTQTVRLDSTSVSVYHDPAEAESLIQFGYSRPDLKQFKAMMATLDPLGMPLVCQMIAGNKNDEGLYRPTYDSVVKNLGTRSLLIVGDSKMGALSTRAYIAAGKSRYLCAYRPASATNEINRWIDRALEHSEQWQFIEKRDKQTSLCEIKTAIYEWERQESFTDSQGSHSWNERVMMVWSAAYQRGLLSHREEILKRLTGDLEKLRLPPKRGRKRYDSQQDLEKVAASLIAKARLEGIVAVSLKQESSAKPYWVVDRIWVDISEWRDMVKRLGWQVYLSNTTEAEYPATKLVAVYNQQVLEERGFSRLKTRNLQIRPVYLRDEQRISGLLWLLCLALRILTLTEYRLRTALAQRNEELAGLNPASRTQKTSSPTTERVIAAFSNITLTIIIGQNFAQRHVSALNSVQQHILLLLNLPLDLYQSLERFSY